MDSPVIRELRGNILDLKRKVTQYVDKGSGNLLISLRKAPVLAITYGELLREVKVQEILYQFILQMYEQAKLNEAKNIPVVQVLELAQPPQKRVRPKRSLFCIVSFFVGLGVVSILVLCQKWYQIQKSNQTEAYNKLTELRQHILFRK